MKMRRIYDGVKKSKIIKKNLGLAGAHPSPSNLDIFRVCLSLVSPPSSCLDKSLLWCLQ